jgi:hypothetical protein
VCDGALIASRAQPAPDDLGGFPAAARVIAALRDRLRDG